MEKKISERSQSNFNNGTTSSTDSDKQCEIIWLPVDHQQMETPSDEIHASQLVDANKIGEQTQKGVRRNVKAPFLFDFLAQQIRSLNA